MANPVTIYIHHQSYRFLAEEEETYLQQCADIVNKEMDQAMAGNTLSITDGAVLAAMNVADKYCKERQVSDNLRAQLKQALDENTRLARELAEALLLVYLAAYALFRFALEFLRGDAARGMWGVFSTSQLLALVTLAAVLPLLIRHLRTYGKQPRL